MNGDICFFVFKEPPKPFNKALSGKKSQQVRCMRDQVFPVILVDFCESSVHVQSSWRFHNFDMSTLVTKFCFKFLIICVAACTVKSITV